MNDITLDHVLHRDPGSYKVIEKLVQYMEQVAVIDEFNSHESGGDMPVCGIIAPTTADGGPAKRWLDFQATNIKEAGLPENRKYKLPRFFLGGFHSMMEFLSMRGCLSRSYRSIPATSIFTVVLWGPLASTTFFPGDS
jgi:hypothetical protein